MGSVLVLLRKLRRDMLKGNAFWRYASYAFGEIALVVVGIIIALQVDSWVEARKLREFEIEMITEVRDACLRDVSYYEMLEQRLDALDESYHLFINAIAKGMTAEDIEPIHFYQLKYGIQFQYNDGPYEAIKSTGLDRISNDRIRRAMVRLFDFWLPRSQILLQSAHEFYYLKEMDLWDEITSERVERDEETEEYRMVSYYEFTNVLKDPRFLKILQLASDRANWSRMRLEAAKMDVSELASMIEEEFEQERVELPPFDDPDQ